MGIQQYYIDKKIQRALKKSTKIKANRSLSIIDKIAIFIDEESLFKQKDFQNLEKLIGLDSTHFNILTFKTKKTSYNEFRGAVVLQNDINWQGKITSKDVLEFLNREYDLLIDFTQAENQGKQLIISEIKASFKVGYKDNKDELYDFMIGVNPAEVALFTKEMVHYLKILNLL